MHPFHWHHTPIEPMPILIEASAGTGKTYAITGLFLRLLLEGHVERVREILVVTFTNAATRELTERIRLRLRETHAAFKGENDDPELMPLVQKHGAAGIPILNRACLEMEELSIFTIHGFCKRMLEQNAFESGLTFTPTFLEDHADILTQAAHDFWRQTFIEGPGLLAELAVAMKWSPKTLLEDTQDCRHQWGALFVPTPLPFEQAFEACQNGLKELANHWEPEFIAPRFRELRFPSKKAPYAKGQVETYLQQLEQATHEPLKADSLHAVLQADIYCHLEMLGKREREKENAISLLSHPFWQACGDVAEAIRHLETSFRLQFLEQVDNHFKTLKLRSHQLDFDDLLEQMHDVLNHPLHGKAIRRAIGFQFKAALIDEFQDTDQKQFEIFHQLFPQVPLFFIGDPKQAIYSFRGADLHAYLAARGAAGRQYTLSTNWRSHQELVEAVNQLFSLRAEPFLEKNIQYLPVQASGLADSEGLSDDKQALQLWLIPPGRKSAEALNKEVLVRMTREILALLMGDVSLGKRPLIPSDLAILVRTHAQGELVLNTLRQFGVPSTLAGKGDIFQTQEMEDLLLFMRAVIHPQQPHVLPAAMTTSIWGATAEDIHELSIHESALAKALAKLEGLRGIWQRLGFLAMMHTAYARLGTLQRLLGKPQGKLRLTYLRHAAEVIQQHSNRKVLTPDGLVRWLQSERGKPHHEGLDTNLRMATDELGVQIMTIHKSKGLEYQVVFCPFFWKESRGQKNPTPKFHNEAGHIVFDLQKQPEETHQRLAGREVKAEDLRLLYVALTRARQRCYLVWKDIDPLKNLALGAFFENQDSTLESWADQWPHLMATETLSESESPPSQGLVTATPDPAQLHPPPYFAGINHQPWRMTSFTALTANYHGSQAHRYDPGSSHSEGFGSGIFGFARGARAGNCLHEILEHISLGELGTSAVSTRVENTLHRYDLADPDRHLTPIKPQKEVLELLHKIASTPLPRSGIQLGQVGEADQLKEWPFHLPITQFQPADLQHVFRQHEHAAIAEFYAPLLTQLNAESRWNGFLTGIVDLCFCSGNRWYLLDWKSNDLGPTPQHYDTQHLWQAMCDHHYVLQYHLYAVALHRFLKSRIRDYDYDQHFGGIYYAFLRGIDGSSPSGWYFDRPSKSFIHQLDLLFEGRIS